MSTFIEIIACLFIAYAALPLMSSAGQAWPGRACFSQAGEPIAELLTLGSQDGAPTKMHASERPVLHLGPVRAQVRVGLVVCPAVNGLGESGGLSASGNAMSGLSHWQPDPALILLGY